MSSIAITPSATGTGTISLAAPVTATNRTLTLPDATGTVLSTATPGVPIGGPAFSAVSNTNQTLTNAVFTKVILQSELFDTNNSFDNTTTFRFTPNVAGYYQVNALVQAQIFAALAANIQKNGVGDSYSVGLGTSGQLYSSVALSKLYYMNGTTDYIELFAYQATGASTSLLTGGNSLSAVLVRSAT